MTAFPPDAGGSTPTGASMTAGGSTPTGGNTTTATAQPGPQSTTRYRRSRQDRWLAGVCGGVARTLGIDPIVLRVAVVVLSVFGGAGIVVYVAGWLLLPDGDDEQSLAQRALGGRIGGNRAKWLLAGMLIVALSISLHAVFGEHSGPWHPAVALLVVGAVVFAYKRGRAGTWPPAASTGSVPSAPVAWTPPAPTGPTVGFDQPAPTAPLDPTTAWNLTAPSVPTPPSPPMPPPVMPPAAPVAKPPRSRLGTSIFCIVLLALGVLAAVDALGADVPLPAYPATVVAGAGLGLLIATWYGRARGLIALGLLGMLALPPTAFAQEFHGSFVHGTRTLTPTTAGELLPSYEYRGGEVRLDLSRLDLAGQDAHSTVRLGAGELIVTVPARTDVTVHVKLSAGQYETFDAEDGGVDLDRTVRDEGADGPGGGTLDLTIRQGVGHLEVRRADPAVQTPATPDTEIPHAAA
jgi:phage shock protein PspC (stress-responsive transcriptional regulator)